MTQETDSSATDSPNQDKTEKILRFLAESVPAEQSGNFFRKALTQIAEYYGVRWAFIGLFSDQSRIVIRTRTFYDNGNFPPDITYLVADAPCEKVGQSKLEWVPAGVKEKYPNDLLLKALGVESYFGVSLEGCIGPLGVLVVMDDKPMEVADQSKSVLGSFAIRIAAELDRSTNSQELKRRDTILHAVTEISSRFLGTCSLQDCIYNVLKILGQATGASRAYLAQNQTLNGQESGIYPQQVWIAEGIQAQPGHRHPEKTPNYPQPARWARTLNDRSPIQGSVRDFPSTERRLFQDQGIKSLVVVPIFVDETWWGVIGFEDRLSERIRSDAEIEALQSAADMVGAAISHDRAEKELNFAASVYHNSLEAIMITDADDRIIRVNPAFSDITGYVEQEIVGRHVDTLRSGRHDPKFYQLIGDSLRQSGFWQGEIWSRRKNGEVYPQQMNISISKEKSGQSVHYIALFNDISDQKRYQTHIQHLALYDPLTDLPNRRLFQERLDQALRESGREKNLIALLYIDLDNFKPVNDTFGHATGDQLLRDVTGRLRNIVREADTLARLGGDEFTIILHGLPDDKHSLSRVGDIADQVIQALTETYQINKHDITLSASVGIALFPRDAATRKELILNADRAMYHAKECGKGNFKFYSEEMNKQARKRLILENRLRTALANQELQVHYQPQTDLESGRIIGLEALIRWEYTDKRLLYPDEFIPLAEDTGQIIPIGYWVIRTACNQLKQWRDRGFKRLTMTVNLSPRQLLQINFTEQVAKILRETGVSPELLEFDTTEKILLGRGRDSREIDTLTDLKKMGIHIALDDFGTGYSSLAQLRDCPLDILKIDGSFIGRIPQIPEASQLAAAIISLAHGLNLRVVAEGVESAAQLEFLRQQHCDGAQGLMLGDSLPPEKILLLLDPGWRPGLSRLAL